MNKIIIGTRGSELALLQANTVAKLLALNGYACELKVILTKGDKVQNLGFDKMEGKGFFTKELETALRKKEIDLAVHSYKDIETGHGKKLLVGAVIEREAPSDILIIRRDAVDIKEKFFLKKRATVGTSAVRRKAQMVMLRPDVKMKDLRGNVPTRIQKLREGVEYDAIIIAYAGVRRLGLNLSEFEVHKLKKPEFIPAPAQGAIAVQIHKDNIGICESLKKISHIASEETTAIERQILELFKGGCQLPIGAYCEKEDSVYKLWACVAESWGAPMKRIFLRAADPSALAELAVKKLKKNFHSPSVFITRNAEEAPLFVRLLEQNKYSISALSLTWFQKEDFDKVSPCDWIFFSSKNCVKYFFAQQPVLRKVKYGTIGGATDAALRKFGVKPDFIPLERDSLNTEEIGKQFAKIAGNSTVLFPQSSSSFRTVQKQFPSHSDLIDLIVYHTFETQNIEIPTTDVVVLTSPSNAISYLRKKKIKPEQKVIAMGVSTGKTLEEHGINNYILPWSPNELALADAVMSL